MIYNPKTKKYENFTEEEKEIEMFYKFLDKTIINIYVNDKVIDIKNILRTVVINEDHDILGFELTCIGGYKDE